MTGGERGLLVLRWISTLAIADNGGRKDLESVVDGGDDKDIGMPACMYGVDVYFMSSLSCRPFSVADSVDVSDESRETSHRGTGVGLHTHPSTG